MEEAPEASGGGGGGDAPAAAEEAKPEEEEEEEDDVSLSPLTNGYPQGFPNIGDVSCLLSLCS